MADLVDAPADKDVAAVEIPAAGADHNTELEFSMPVDRVGGKLGDMKL